MPQGHVDPNIRRNRIDRYQQGGPGSNFKTNNMYPSNKKSYGYTANSSSVNDDDMFDWSKASGLSPRINREFTGQKLSRY
jgi:hypothetical protein